MLYINDKNDDGINSSIAILCTHTHGGAGLAAKRLSESLNCDIIALDKFNQDPADNFLHRVQSNLFTNTYFTIYNRSKEITPEGFLEKVSQYDYINIHWINGFISVSMIDKLADTGKKILITCHDYWHFTGGCHYPAGCDKFYDEFGCYDCPQIQSSIQQLKENTYLTQLDKLKILNKPNVYILAPSHFVLAEAAKALKISTKHPKLHLIRNPYEPHSDWVPTDKSEKIYHYVLCAGSMDERRKGYMQVLNAFSSIAAKRDDFKLHIISKKIEYDSIEPNLHKHLEVHHNKDHDYITGIYKKCDFVISSSFEENWSNVLVESGCYGCIPIVTSYHGSAEYAKRYCTCGLIYNPSNVSLLDVLNKSLTMSKDKLATAQLAISKLVRKEHSYKNVKNQYYQMIYDINKSNIESLHVKKKEFIVHEPYFIEEESTANYEYLKFLSFLQNISSSIVSIISQQDLHIFSKSITEALKDHNIVLKVNNHYKPGVEINNDLIKLKVISSSGPARVYYRDHYNITLSKGDIVQIKVNNEGYYGIRSLSVVAYIEPQM